MTVVVQLATTLDTDWMPWVSRSTYVCTQDSALCEMLFPEQSWFDIAWANSPLIPVTGMHLLNSRLLSIYSLVAHEPLLSTIAYVRVRYVPSPHHLANTHVPVPQSQTTPPTTYDNVPPTRRAP